MDALGHRDRPHPVLGSQDVGGRDRRGKFPRTCMDSFLRERGVLHAFAQVGLRSTSAPLLKKEQARKRNRQTVQFVISEIPDSALN